MKVLEKKEMQSIQGGTCWNNGDGTSSCHWIDRDGHHCYGTWTWGGLELDYQVNE